MAKSKCCKSSVHIASTGEYGDYFVCDVCLCECDIMKIKHHHKEMDNAEVQPGIVLEAVDVPY